MSFEDRIILNSISLNNINYLYQLLQERDSSITITQKNLPTITEHKIFVENQMKSINGNKNEILKMKQDPYDGWYIITSENLDLGSIWIEENGNIGLQIQKQYQNLGIGVIAFKKIQILHEKNFYKTTVSHQNQNSIKFCEKMGFKLKEKTSDRIIFTKSC
tara:strand:- start:21022 stop:21504 length:483 start_codon:yes stop_codon:yes gene_type:complete